MNKKLIAIIAAMALIMTAAGCAKKDSGTKNNNSGNTQQTDASGAYGENADTSANNDGNYADNIDMNIIDGEEGKSENDKNEYDGDVGDVSVSIEDAKIINYQDEDVVIVSFKYKNNSDEEMPFTGSLRVEAYQNDSKLPATVVDNVEGVDMMALTQNVKKGETIMVQKAYKMRDKSPVTVEVSEFFVDENSGEGLTKTFNF